MKQEQYETTQYKTKTMNYNATQQYCSNTKQYSDEKITSTMSYNNYYNK
jgi:hypothetical protein